MYHRLIQETEQPKRNPATGADLGIVNCEVTVWDIRNLFEGLSLAAHLKDVLVVDDEVSLLRVTDIVQDAQLADEECLPLVSLDPITRPSGDIELIYVLDFMKMLWNGSWPSQWACPDRSVRNAVP